MTDKPSDKPVNDGGPAFARAGFYDGDGPRASDNQPADGMSLRAWLTAQYGAAIISALYSLAVSTDTVAQFHETMVKTAMSLADETLAALDAPPGE